MVNIDAPRWRDSPTPEADYWNATCCGDSTGTNFIGALHLVHRMHCAGERGSIVTILCDSGNRYMQSYYDTTTTAGWPLAGSICSRCSKLCVRAQRTGRRWHRR